MTTTDYVEQFNETLATITQPLVQQYNDLDGEIKKREEEIVSMRKARTQLRGMLRSINPELVPKVNKNGKKSKPSGPTNSEAKLEAFTQWLQDRAEEINANDGIYASGIVDSNGVVKREDWDVPIKAQSQISNALRTLHERGIIRLDHTGNGGAKFYKVVV